VLLYAELLPEWLCNLARTWPGGFGVTVEVWLAGQAHRCAKLPATLLCRQLSAALQQEEGLTQEEQEAEAELLSSFVWCAAEAVE
jgi:hypothetical protein